MLEKIADKVKLEFEQTFMFYLPRICEHCLNPSCAASCPSGAIYKRSEDGIVLVDQDRCRGWRMCVTGCPYKKVYFNHRTGKAEKCTFCFPRVEVGIPTVCSETCVGRLRYIGLVLYDADRVLEAASTPDEQDLYEAQRSVFLDPHDPAVIRAAEQRRHPAGLDRRRAALAGLGADQPVRGGAAAASGVPHDADGLVHPAAVAGRRRRPTDTGHDAEDARQPVRRHRRAAHPGRVPRRAVHRRRHRSRCDAVLRRLAAMRSYMRDINLGRPADESIAAAVGMTGADVQDMYRLLAIAKYDERYVIPTAHAEQAHELEELATECSLDYEGGPGMGGSGPFGESSGGADADRGGELPHAAGPADQRHRRRAADKDAAGSTCSTGTARAHPDGLFPPVDGPVGTAPTSPSDETGSGHDRSRAAPTLGEPTAARVAGGLPAARLPRRGARRPAAAAAAAAARGCRRRSPGRSAAFLDHLESDPAAAARRRLRRDVRPRGAAAAST